MGVDPYLIAPTLLMSMAQRLVRKIVPNTGKPIPIQDSTAEMLQQQFADLPQEFLAHLPLTETVYEPQKSSNSESGLQGRVPVAELFIVDKAIEKIILENPTENAVYQQVRKRGFLTMKEDAILKSMQGIVPWNEVNGL